MTKLNGKPEQYYVIRKQLEEVTDDFVIDRISVDEVEIGQEKWILNGFEKQEGYALGEKLSDIGKDGVVVVVQGRVVTENEVDLKRDAEED